MHQRSSAAIAVNNVPALTAAMLRHYKARISRQLEPRLAAQVVAGLLYVLGLRRGDRQGLAELGRGVLLHFASGLQLWSSRCIILRLLIIVSRNSYQHCCGLTGKNDNDPPLNTPIK